jgi:Mrp family chromosome partitioning ATPase
MPAVPDTLVQANLAPRATDELLPQWTRFAGSVSDTLTQLDLVSLQLLEDEFREVYTHALPDLDKAQGFVLGITSAIRGEGRTSCALGLTLAVAHDLDRQVLLVELDLERPKLAGTLHLPEYPGLVDVVSGNEELPAALHPCLDGAVHVLPAGRLTGSASRVLRSDMLRQLISSAIKDHHLVVLDMPPALSGSDVVPLGELTDGVLVVVRASATPARFVDQAIAKFDRDKVRGIVLNGQRSKIPAWLRNWI